MRKSNTLQSVENGLRLVKLLAMDSPVLGTTEIAQTLGLNKSTTSRLLTDLISEGFIEKKGRKYTLGLAVLSLSGVIVSNLEIHREALETLKSLVNIVDETVHLCVLEGSSVTYIHKIDCKQPVRLLSHIGKKNPASCTSSGKVMLAYESPKVLDKVIEDGLPHMGPNSITEQDQFRKEIRHVKSLGYAVCIDEMHEDVISVAAPVFNYSNAIVAAVSIAGPRQRMEKQPINHYIEHVVNAGKEVSYRLGHLA
jgi:IclR family KDG regulon transcriptional repressor